MSTRKKRGTDAGEAAQSEKRSASEATVAASSVPPAAATDAPVGECLRTLALCGHPNACRSTATVLDADGAQWPVTWCGACGAIALTHGKAGATAWVRAGLVQALDTEALARWTSDAEVIALAAAEVIRALRALRRRLPPSSEIAVEARQLDEATTELERAVREALGEGGSVARERGSAR
jgi:hypothetical protein